MTPATAPTPAARPDGTAPAAGPVRLWVGTYPADGPGGAVGTGEGIWLVELDPATGRLEGRLAAATPTPSFLATHPGGRWLYAAGEWDEGSLTAFEVHDDGTLTERHRLSSDGGWPCHLLVDPARRALWATNYETGSVVVVPLAPDGGFAPEAVEAGRPTATFGHQGSGPRADRQEGPHAHSSTLVDGGWLLVADLGTDELRRFRVADDGGLVEHGTAFRFAPGTGPRHLAVGPGGHLYVVGELTATLHVLAWDGASGTAHELQAVPACASPVVSGTHLYPAHPVVAGDGLLVGVRGADVVSRFALLDGGARVEHRADAPVGGAWPRHLALLPGDASDGGAAGWVVVAVQNSGLVTSLPWDGEAVGDVTGSLPVPYPACVVPA